MKKETALKKLANYRATIDTAVQNIRDLVYDLEDADLSDNVDGWVEAVEEFFDIEGDLQPVLSAVEEFYDNGEDE